MIAPRSAILALRCWTATAPPCSTVEPVPLGLGHVTEGEGPNDAGVGAQDHPSAHLALLTWELYPALLDVGAEGRRRSGQRVAGLALAGAVRAPAVLAAVVAVHASELQWWLQRWRSQRSGWWTPQRQQGPIVWPCRQRQKTPWSFHSGCSRYRLVVTGGSSPVCPASP